MRISENEKIGVLPPGPISNHTLFYKKTADNKLEIRPKLSLNVDYRGVNKDVWQVFYRMYHGGPLIAREALDIYSKDLASTGLSSGTSGPITISKST